MISTDSFKMNFEYFLIKLFACCIVRLWEEAGLCLEAELCTMMVADIIHDESVVRQSSAEALSSALSTHQDYLPAVLQELLEVYEEKLYVSQNYIMFTDLKMTISVLAQCILSLCLSIQRLTNGFISNNILRIYTDQNR